MAELMSVPMVRSFKNNKIKITMEYNPSNELKKTEPKSNFPRKNEVPKRHAPNINILNPGSE